MLTRNIQFIYLSTNWSKSEIIVKVSFYKHSVLSITSTINILLFVDVIIYGEAKAPSSLKI